MVPRERRMQHGWKVLRKGKEGYSTRDVGQKRKEHSMMEEEGTKEG